MFLKYAPRDSAFAFSYRGEAALWSQTDHLIADLIDITARAHFKKSKPYPRPGAEDGKYGGKGLTPDELKARLALPYVEKRSTKKE